MAMNWTSLTGATSVPGSISRWVNKSTLTSGPDGDADLILQEALGSIFGKLRHWQMLTPPTSGTMVVGADQIAVPADLVESDFFMLTGAQYQSVLIQKTPNEVYARWGYDSTGARVRQTPLIYSFNQAYFQLDSPPDLAYTYMYTYYQIPGVLSEDNQTNFLTAKYPRLIRTAVMMAAAEWTKENNQGQYDRTYWEGQLAAELALCQQQSDRARRGQVTGIIFDGATDGPYPAYAGAVW